jgi:hypothetical protein
LHEILRIAILLEVFMNLIFDFRFVLVMMILFLAPGLTQATEEIESTQTMNTKSLEEKEDGHNSKKEFSRGTRKWRTYASFAGGDQGKGNLYALHFGWGKFLWDQFSFNVDVFGTYIRSGIDDNGVGLGLDVIFRQHFLMRNNDNYSVYFDLGGGLEIQSTEFAGTRNFNFRVLGGGGGTIKVTENVRLMSGLRYLHISDAGIDGGGGGFDGYQVYFGIMMPFNIGR